MGTNKFTLDTILKVIVTREYLERVNIFYSVGGNVEFPGDDASGFILS